MSVKDKISNLRNLPLLGLLLAIFAASILLIVINFYTLKTMSSVRAYVNGESNYSKGEKNATQSLISYIHTKDSKDWDDYLKSIKIPLGDSLARVTLLAGGSEVEIRKGFLQGNNHADDIDDMIWLFSTFKGTQLMARPILIWEKGDSLIHQKILIANEVKAAIENDDFESRKNEFLNLINQNTKAVTAREMRFSERLGMVARKITEYLFYTNTVIILLILGSVCFYVLSLLRRLNTKNNALASANKELDLIAYSISHDLRAPINSMMGLLNLAQMENDPEMQKTYIDMLHRTLTKQEQFIKEVIAISKETKQVLRKEIVELNYLIEQVISSHKHMPAASGINFSTHIGVHKVFTDPHRLEIILNNLVSNAIKYHDASKREKMIAIRTYSDNDKIKIDVADNGTGIEAKDKAKIFEMYYMSKDRERGSGLGLYIVKEAINKLEGEIEVKSVKGEGSTFSVVLKK